MILKYLSMVDSFPQDVGYDAHAGGTTTCAQRSSWFILICMYFTQCWLPPHVRISCCSIIIHINDDLQPFANCQYS